MPSPDLLNPLKTKAQKMESHLKTKSVLSPEQSGSTFYDISCLRHCWLLLLTCQLEMQSMIILMLTSVLSLLITKELRICGICTSGRTHTNRIKRRTHTMGNRVPNSVGRKVSTSRYAKRSQTKRLSTFIHPASVLFSWSCPCHLKSLFNFYFCFPFLIFIQVKSHSTLYLYCFGPRWKYTNLERFQQPSWGLEITELLEIIR